MRSQQAVSRSIGILLALVSLAFGARVIVGQTGQRDVIYQSTIQVPASDAPEADVVDPLAARAAVAAAMGQGEGALEQARSDVPLVPWNEHGLSRVAIDPEAARYDEARDAYVVDLEDGAVAVLTYRPALQRHLSTLVARYEEPGEAVVVIEPETGRVLAMVDDGVDPAMGPALARRAPTYAASTFKVITGAALLEAGAVTPETITCYTGGSRGFNLAQLEPEGEEAGACVTFRTAMARSSNLVFGRRADEHLTPASLTEVAARFGFNTDIPFEAALERSVATLPEDRLEFARAAAGFRHTLMTPLHGALIQAAIANDGVMMVPTMVDRIENADGTVRYRHTPFAWRTVLSPEVARALEDTQTETCTTGTARSDFGQRDGWPGSVRAWGKTGTLSNRNADGSEPDPFYLYRWFTGVGVHDGEELAVSGLTVTTALWWIKGTYLASEALLRGLL